METKKYKQERERVSSKFLGITIMVKFVREKESGVRERVRERERERERLAERKSERERRSQREREW